MNYFVTAIGTDSGKTLVSAILCEALGANYWKPVQAGYPTDKDTVRELISNTTTNIFPEAFLLRTAASPHAAARMEGVDIKIENFAIPESSQDLVIEGAGGCLVPLNEHDFVIDLAVRFNAVVILVANLYLGSINHTLLTVEALKARGIPVKGIVFNGPENRDSREIILRHSGLSALLHIEKERLITKDVVKSYAALIKRHFKK
jgi:dethiobiotin synthetase